MKTRLQKIISRRKLLWIFVLAGGFSVSGFAHQHTEMQNFPLECVRLNEGPFLRACELNLKVLMEYDTDRLLAPFLKEAGLSLKGKLFPNWAGLNGHVGGHYLSALALHYASTGNQECKRRMDYMVSELKRCQDSNADGYVGGVPGSRELWTKVKAGDVEAVAKSWVPWYNVHKVYAGLLDAWTYGKSETARNMFLALCDWGISIIRPLSDKQMEHMLDTEFGGMNEVYAEAYRMTGDEKYLDAARRFSHRILLDSMVRGVDNLDNRHANTQVPKAIGYQRVAEVSGDSLYCRAAGFFWETVTGQRSLAFGGNSVREHFLPAEACGRYAEDREGPESCNTYNMLKLTEGLFRMHPEARYADYYERALFNHILSTQHPVHGGYVYFTPARPRHYRVYSTPNEAMWCCVGTGMENHGKYGEFIYTHTDNALYINLFIASSLEWTGKGVRITQHTDFPYNEHTCLTVSVKRPVRFALKLRWPSWVAAGRLEVRVNGKPVPVSGTPSSYVTVERLWQEGDIVSLTLPMETKVEEMPNVPDYLAIMRGPILLGARTGTEDLKGLVADDSRWGHIASGRLLPLTDAPVMIGTRTEIESKLKAMKTLKGQPMHFTCSGLFLPERYDTLVLEPFAGIHDSRYCIYWRAMTADSYRENRAAQARREQAELELDRRTVDKVKPGEQQPEADHRMQTKGCTETGHTRDESWRKATDGGSFSYDLLTEGRKSLILRLRTGGEKIERWELSADGAHLTEGVQTMKNGFRIMEYRLPSPLLEGKTSVRISFHATKNGGTPAIYDIRLLQ